MRNIIIPQSGSYQNIRKLGLRNFLATVNSLYFVSYRVKIIIISVSQYWQSTFHAWISVYEREKEKLKSMFVCMHMLISRLT